MTAGPVPESQFCVVYHYKNYFSLSLETPVHNGEPSLGGHLRLLCKVITATSGVVHYLACCILRMCYEPGLFYLLSG